MDDVPHTEFYRCTTCGCVYHAIADETGDPKYLCVCCYLRKRTIGEGETPPDQN
jgi:hypothetical protein